jgi:hypothetical protein
VLSVLVDLLADRTLIRLVVWSLLTGRGATVFGADGQLGRLVDGMAARLAATGAQLARDRVELAVMIALATVTGWGVLGEAMDRALGRAEPVDRGVLRTELRRMLRVYLAAP